MRVTEIEQDLASKTQTPQPRLSPGPGAASEHGDHPAAATPHLGRPPVEVGELLVGQRELVPLVQDVLQELAGKAVATAPAHSSRERHGHRGAAQHRPVPLRPHPAATIQARHRLGTRNQGRTLQRPPRV